MEFLFTMLGLVVIGLLVGIGVLIHSENPKVAAFFKARPVLAWPLTFLCGGLAMYAIFYLFLFILLLAVGRGAPAQ